MASITCTGCGTLINTTNGWLTIDSQRELYLGDHSKLVTEAAAVVCSWTCLVEAAVRLRLHDNPYQQ